jgi:hypothetical protein
MILTRSTRLSQPADAAGVDSRFGGRNDWLIAPGSPGSLPISGVVPTIPDQYGSSHYFDGASLQVLGNDANVNATGGQFTLLAYAKFDGTGEDRGVVGNRSTTGANAYAHIVHRSSDSNRRIVFTYKGTSASAEVGILSAVQSVPFGSTRLVALVVNGTSVRCYIGSELVGSGASTAPVPSGHLPYLRAGNYYDNTASRGFRGGIYYAGLLPVALSGEDIGALSRNPWKLFRPVQRRVYFDMGAGGGATTSVNADLGADYTIRSTVQSDGSGAYAIRAEVAADASSGYGIRGVVSADAAVSYVVRAPAQADAASTFTVRGFAQADAASTFTVRGFAQADAASTFTVRGFAQADAASTFTVRGGAASDATAAYLLRGAASSDLSASYDIQTASGVSSSVSASYVVRGAAQSDAAAAYDLRKSVGANSEHAFMVRGLVSSDLGSAYEVQAALIPVYADLPSSYAIAGAQTILTAADFAAIRAHFADELAQFRYIQTKVDAAL